MLKILKINHLNENALKNIFKPDDIHHFVKVSRKHVWIESFINTSYVIRKF